MVRGKEDMGQFLELFRGPSPSDQCAKLLLELAKCASACAKLLHETGGADLEGIIRHEHTGDGIVRTLHQIIDNAFIMRIDKSDVTQLLSELDDMIDGMRKVASHIDIHKYYIETLRTEAKQLIEIIVFVSDEVKKLVTMLSGKRFSLLDISTSVHRLHDAESEADKILMRAEKMLISEFSQPHANVIEYIGWEKLFRLLERVTDHANHCGTIILSIARKET